MKAYKVTTDYSEYSEVAFADTPSQAKWMAQQGSHLHDAEWTDLRATRAPAFDRASKHYGLGCWHDADFVRVARAEGWYQVDHGCPCSECGLYEFELLPESVVGDDDLCPECRKSIEAATS